MAIKSNFYNGKSYNPVDFQNQYKGLLSSGVHWMKDNSLKVIAHSPNNQSVDVSIGSCTHNGTFTISDTVVNVPITSNTSGNNRIDSIIVNHDYVAGETTIISKQGNPGTSPVAPDIQPNQLRLANVFVGNNVSAITNGNITDTRIPATLSDQQAIVSDSGIHMSTWQQVGNLVYQSGWATGSGTTYNIIFNKPFPNACIHVLITCDASDAQRPTSSIGHLSATGFTLYTGENLGYHFFAIGY